MANLIVRHIDDAIVLALKQRARHHGVGPEAEHRQILEDALLHPPRKSFAEVLRVMRYSAVYSNTAGVSFKKSFAEVLCLIPNVGSDSDFERQPNNTNFESDQNDTAPNLSA